MKKLLAILMSVILVMVLAIGCAPEETPPEDETPMTDEAPGDIQEPTDMEDPGQIDGPGDEGGEGENMDAPSPGGEGNSGSIEIWWNI